MSKPSFAIGIDFGTTFCCVAILRHPTKKPEVIPSNYSTNTTPSYVAYNAESDDENSDEDDGPFFAGEAAKQEAHENPENTFFDIKRLIGRSFYDPHIQKYKQLWPFHLVNMVGQVGVKIGHQKKLPQEIALELIRHLKKTSEDYLGGPINSAVVTVPVYYNQMQKDLTRGAVEAAGFTSIHFIPEPVAAAVAYGLKSSIGKHEAKTCIIYDLGGGTFDVTVFRLDSSNRVEVKATGGDDRLGGEDFNDLITEFCINEFQRHHGIDLAEGKTSDEAEVRKKTAKRLRRIRDECERQKCYLGSLKSVVVSLDNIHGDVNLLVTVTRSKFEDIIHALLNRSIKILDETVKRSGFEKDEIDEVILIGGSSRIPKVQKIVQEYFEGKQIRRSIDVDEAVACGAAIQAYNVFNETPFSTVTLIKEPITLAELKAIDCEQPLTELTLQRTKEAKQKQTIAPGQQNSKELEHPKRMEELQRIALDLQKAKKPEQHLRKSNEQYIKNEKQQIALEQQIATELKQQRIALEQQKSMESEQQQWEAQEKYMKAERQRIALEQIRAMESEQQQRNAEEQYKKAEQQQIALEQIRTMESEQQQRNAEEQYKKAEQQRIALTQIKAMELAQKQRKAEEQYMKAEQQRIALEQIKAMELAQKQRKAEEQYIKAEQLRIAVEQIEAMRLKQQQRKAEEERIALEQIEAMRLKQQQRKAEEQYKKAEQQQMALTQIKAMELKQQRRKAEEQRIALKMALEQIEAIRLKEQQKKAK